MAYLVSISVSTPLCAPPTSFKKMCWGKEPLGALAKTAISVSGTNHLFPCSSNRGLFSVNLSCHLHLTSSSKPLDGIVSFLDVSSCTHTTIAGYWVGPDIDDGWGYVEAFVNQIT
ncbi:hypothetical protein AB3S75_012239 [Citrus x aurantiifolia]